MSKLKDISIFAIMVFVCFLTFTFFVDTCQQARAEEKTKQEWTQLWEDKKNPEKFKSVTDGVIDGKGWCLNPKNKCYDGIRKRLRARYDTYEKWFEQYSSGMIPAHVALTSTTEAPAGPSQCSPDPKLRECGILGLKMLDAKECDINVASPEASIWCFSYLATKRRIAANKLYENLDMAPKYDQYIIGGISGGIGQLAKYIIDKSGALDTIGTDGSTKLKYPSPYERILTWLKHYSSKKPKTMMDMIFAGRISDYKVGLRVARFHAVMEIIKEFYKVDTVNDINYPELILIDRPKNLPTFPGNNLHGNFKKFPDMLVEIPHD